jgi:hypothetical protein
MTHKDKTAPIPGPTLLLTEMQAGDSLGLTPRTLQAWRHPHGGPAPRRSGAASLLHPATMGKTRCLERPQTPSRR